MSVRLSLSRRERTFARAAGNVRQRWTERSALIVRLEADGVHGTGEASPLPGFSPDALPDTQQALASYDCRTLSTRLEPGQSVFAELARASSRIPSCLPAARCALEAALLDLWARASDSPAWALLREPAATGAKPRALAALLTGEPEEASYDAARAAARGITTYKLKVGRASGIDREVAAVARLRAEYGSAVRLRLDANQSFSAEQARFALPRFTAHHVEYIEEPCALADFAQLASLGVPLALDESLALRPATADGAEELRRAHVRALVLKPTLVGGIAACSAWARVAEACGAKLILSHAFEGPLGFALGATLALGLGCEDSAHGLDPEGAGLEATGLPFFDGPLITPWPDPGFGDWPGSA